MRVRLLVVEEEVEEVVDVRRRTCKIDFQEIKASDSLAWAIEGFLIQGMSAGMKQGFRVVVKIKKKKVKVAEIKIAIN